MFSCFFSSPLEKKYARPLAKKKGNCEKRKRKKLSSRFVCFVCYVCVCVLFFCCVIFVFVRVFADKKRESKTMSNSPLRNKEEKKQAIPSCAILSSKSFRERESSFDIPRAANFSRQPWCAVLVLFLRRFFKHVF